MTSLHYRSEGFVFRKHDRLDADRVFSVFTKDFGRVEIFGKAIRKITSKLRAGIDIFYLSDIEFVQGKNRKTLTDASCLRKFKTVAQSPEKLQVAHAISRLVDEFIKGQEDDQKIYTFIVDALGKLDDSGLPDEKYRLVYQYFFWNFVGILGHGPELSVCALCRQDLNPKVLYFSPKEGGIICAKCHVRPNAIEVTEDAVKVLRLAVASNWDVFIKLKIEASCQEALAKVLHNYHDYLLEEYSTKRL